MKHYKVTVRYRKKVVLSDGEEIMGDEYIEEMEASSALDAKTLITDRFARQEGVVGITSALAEETDPPDIDWRKEA